MPSSRTHARPSDVAVPSPGGSEGLYGDLGRGPEGGHEPGRVRAQGDSANPQVRRLRLAIHSAIAVVGATSRFEPSMATMSPLLLMRKLALLVLLAVLHAPDVSGIGGGPRPFPLSSISQLSPSATPTHSSTRWVAPVGPPVVVVHAFRRPVADWAPGHRGVDLQADVGASIRSPADGVIAFKGIVAGRPVVVVRHGPLRSTFEPATTSLAVGTAVAKGSSVATLQAAAELGHCSPTSCLHWGVLRGEQYLDPMSLLAPRRVRLLPLP